MQHTIFILCNHCNVRHYGGCCFCVTKKIFFVIFNVVKYIEYTNMTAIKKTVSGEATVITTTTDDIKADILNRVEQMYDYVKGAGDDLKIKRFFHFLDEMTEITREIDEGGLLEDERMFDVWELITDFNDEVVNEMPIGSAQEYLEKRLSSIIKVLQGEKIFFRG